MPIPRPVWIITTFLLLQTSAQAGVDETFARSSAIGSYATILAKIFQTEIKFKRSYALVVGISDYDHHEKLSAPVKDAQRVRDFLRDEADFDHIIMLTDEKATNVRIGQLMETWYPNVVGPDDRFLFYFSGHGATRSFPRGNKRGYLVLKRSGDQVWDEMIGMPSMRIWAQNLDSARHSLFVLDACFSGFAGFQSSGVREKTIARLMQPSHQMLTAGTENEKSWSYGETSLFTSAFLASARGARISAPGEVISLQEILSGINRSLDAKRAELNDRIQMSPHLWDTRTENNGGSFFFVNKSAPSATPSPAQNGELAPLQSKSTDANNLESNHDPAAIESFKLGQAALGEGRDFRAAADYFSRAVKIEPDFGEAVRMRGVSLLHARNRDWKMSELDDLAPGAVERSSARFEKDTKAALADFDTVIGLKPNSPKAYIDRAGIFFGRKELGRARSDLEKALELDPTDARAKLMRGRVLIEQRHFDQAIEDLSELVRLEAKDSEALARLGDAFRLKGALGAALSSYRAALNVDPKQYTASSGIDAIVQAYMDQGNNLLKSGNSKAAVDAFTEAIRIDGRSMRPLLARGNVYLSMKDAQRALYDFDAAIRLEPSNANSHVLRGDAHRANGEMKKARTSYLVALSLDPKLQAAIDGMRRVQSSRR